MQSPLPTIAVYVARFLDFARRNTQFTFDVTRIGCGLAGYTDEQIAPMFRDAPPNCLLPPEWIPFTRPNDGAAGTRPRPLADLTVGELTSE